MERRFGQRFEIYDRAFVSRRREETAAGDDTTAPDANQADPGPRPKHRWPASIGLSVLVGPGPATDELRVTVRLARCRRVEVLGDSQRDGNGNVKKRDGWERVPVEPITVHLPLDPQKLERGVPLPSYENVSLVGKLSHAPGQGLPPGARAVSVFLVNREPVDDPRQPDEGCLFQVELELGYGPGFVPRPNQQGLGSPDWDDNVNDVQFRSRCEWGAGHGIAIEVAAREGERVTALRTTWLPQATVKRVKTREDSRVETRMEALARLANGAEAKDALSGLVDAYGEWVQVQRQTKSTLGLPERIDTAEALMDDAETARQRIAEGITLVAEDAEIRRAFQLANQAMAEAARRRGACQNEPRWRLFQLAFLLLNIPGIAHPENRFRDAVELIFFPNRRRQDRSLPRGHCLHAAFAEACWEKAAAWRLRGRGDSPVYAAPARLGPALACQHAPLCPRALAAKSAQRQVLAPDRASRLALLLGPHPATAWGPLG